MSRSRAWPESISSSPPASSICVNALMSAPAEKTTGIEEAITIARISPDSLTRSQTVPRSSITCGRDRVHRRVREPGDRDVAARLELDRVGLVALVGLRVGVEALAGLLPSRPWATRRLQDGRRREALAVLRLGRLELLEHDVEAEHVGPHERREDPAARVHPGAGHHPEVDLAHRADALLEHAGRPRPRAFSFISSASASPSGSASPGICGSPSS